MNKLDMHKIPSDLRSLSVVCYLLYLASSYTEIL